MWHTSDARDSFGSANLQVFKMNCLSNQKVNLNQFHSAYPWYGVNGLKTFSLSYHSHKTVQHTKFAYITIAQRTWLCCIRNLTMYIDNFWMTQNHVYQMSVNTLMLRPNGCHFPDCMLKSILSKQNCCILIETRTNKTSAFWEYPHRLMITHTIDSYQIPSKKIMERM